MDNILIINADYPDLIKKTDNNNQYLYIIDRSIAHRGHINIVLDKPLVINGFVHAHSLSSNCNITIAHDININKNITINGNLNAINRIYADGDIECTGNIRTEENIICKNNIVAYGYIEAHGHIECKNIESKDFINISGRMIVDENAIANNDISCLYINTGGNIKCNNLIVEDRITAGGTIVSTGHIGARYEILSYKSIISENGICSERSSIQSIDELKSNNYIGAATNIISGSIRCIKQLRTVFGNITTTNGNIDCENNIEAEYGIIQSVNGHVYSRDKIMAHRIMSDYAITSSEIEAKELFAGLHPNSDTVNAGKVINAKNIKGAVICGIVI